MITYNKGNLFDNLSSEKPNVIIHVCNDSGGWGSGFVLAVNKFCGNKPQDMYREWYDKTVGPLYEKSKELVEFKLGQIQLAPTKDKNTYVINMIGQSTPGGCVIEIGNDKITIPPIRYESLEECLYRVKSIVDGRDINLVGPKFGAGLAGGDWNKIEAIINKVGLDITIWEL